MKKLFFETILLGSVLAFPLPMMAGVDVGMSVSLPPPIVFAAPPEVVVLPETYVYAVPDVDADMFFYNGWWWRLWDGRWYRSYRYDSGWAYYQRVPSFYTGIPSGWRNDFRDHRWKGHQWNYQRIPQQQVQRNWKSWEKSKHWEKQQTWGVQGLKPQTRSNGRLKRFNQDLRQTGGVRSIQAEQQRPRSREAQPQQTRPQSQTVKTQSRGAQQPQQPRPQPREAQPQHAQPQHQATPQQSKPQHGNPERGGEEKQERR